MAEWHTTPDGAGSRNGLNWSNAWSENDLNSNWGSVGATDTVWLSGGTTKAVYNVQLKPTVSGSSQSNPLKIKRSTDSGHNGKVILFGGRSDELLAAKKSGSTPGGQEKEGIFLGNYGNILIDGQELGGITIHGWNKDGIKMWSSNPGGHTFKNLYIYDNGSTNTYSVAEDGIAIAGSNNLIEDCIILDNRADAIQGISGSDISNLTVRRCMLGNTRSHPDFKAASFNYFAHPDGVQMPDGISNSTFEDLLIVNCWHAFIPDETDGACTNTSFERITFINCGTAIRHKHNSSNNNTYQDWVVKKWNWYPNDDGVGYAGGTNFHLRGTGHTFNRIFWSGGGAVVNSTGSSTFSSIYTDGSSTNTMPSQLIISPNFANAGPYGDSDLVLTADWDLRSLESGNATLQAFQNPYAGPLDFYKTISGIDYTRFPAKVHADGNNTPYFEALPTRNINASTDVNYQVAANHPDGNTLSYSVSGPSWLSISSTGLLSGQTSADGTYSAVVTISGGGKSAKGRISIVVGSGNGGGSPPTLEHPGSLSHKRGVPMSYQMQANDPDGDTLSFVASGLPAGLGIDGSSGLISGTPQNEDEYTARVTVTANGDSVTQEFGWSITASGESGATLLFDIETQRINLGDTLSLLVASSKALSVGGSLTSAPPWLSLGIVQPEELPLGDNTAPVLGAIGAQSATVDSPYSLQLTATDADSDSLTYTVTSGTLPAGITLTSGGLLSGTPTAASTPSITIQVDDGNGGTDSETFVFTVSAAANNAPVLTDPPDQTATVGTAFSLQMSATDADSDPLTWALTNEPSWMSINSSGLIQGNPDTAETVTVTVTVNDGNGGTDSIDFDIVVSGAGNPAVTVDAESDGNNGQGGALVGGEVVHTWNLGSVNGSDFIITRTIASHPTLNGGSGPTFSTAQLFGHDRINLNVSGGTTYHLITIDFSQPVDSHRHGAIAINSSQNQGVQDISNSGTPTNIGNNADGYIEWLGLGGVSQLTYVVRGDAGIYATAPKGDTVVSAS